MATTALHLADTWMTNEIADLSNSVVLRLTNKPARLVAAVNPTFSHNKYSLFAYQSNFNQ